MVVATASKVGLCVVGTGRMGKLYMELISKYLNNTYLAAVVSRSLSRAEELCKIYNCRPYDNLEKALMSKDVDAVVIATPTYTHADLIIRSCEYGKHVFVEKPIDVDLIKAEGAVRKCRKYGVKLQVGYMRRFEDSYAKAKEVVDSGVLGEPLVYIGISKDPEPPPPGWLRDPRLSGGLVLDLMSHDIDLAMWYLRDVVTEVYATGGNYVVKDLGDYDTVVAHLRMSRGKSALIYGSRKSTYGYDIRSEIHCSLGTVMIGSEANYNLKVCSSKGITVEGYPWFQRKFLSAYINELNAFINSIINDEEPKVSGEEALRVLKVAIAINESVKSGKPVSIS